MKSLIIGNVKLKNNVILAPMAGYSDVGLRALAHKYGAGLTVTEMVSAKALDMKNKKTEMLLATTDDERPVAVQLFGHEPAVFERVCESGILDKFDIIDLNMGCPTPKIVANGDGSALLDDFNLAEKIIRTCVKCSGKPVTVKFRIGKDEKHIVAVDFAKMCENAGASAIAVHGRTVDQGYSGKSNLGIIKDVVCNVNIPVIASGDCVDKESFEKIVEQTGVAGVMIGRAAIGHPEIFAKCIGKNVKIDKIEQLKEHISILKQYYNDKLVALVMRGTACHYLKAVPGTAELRKNIVKVTKTEQILTLLDDFLA